jgi:protein tyrosine phosphatase (PTP) superfamily phosphohydrolase (DUF442 family)
MDLALSAQPVALGGIQNFGWVEPGVLARGEQPRLDEDASFEALYAAGIRTILSLRPDNEPPPVPAGQRVWPIYHVEEERSICVRVGLHFRHAGLQDFSAPHPAELARTLAVLDVAIATAPAVFVHCRAGAGRTALVSGAWTIAHGWSGNDAAAAYAHFIHHAERRFGLDAEAVLATRRRVGQPRVWWALHRVAEALGSPITATFDLLPPEQPPAAHDWPAGYWEVLRPWRERRAGSVMPNGR